MKTKIEKVKVLIDSLKKNKVLTSSNGQCEIEYHQSNVIFVISYSDFGDKNIYGPCKLKEIEKALLTDKRKWK